MEKYAKHISTVFFLLLTTIAPSISYSQPSHTKKEINIVNTIAPLWAISHAITKGTTTKNSLIIQNKESPHDYHLKPSQLKMIQKADIVVMIDPKFESFLKKYSSKHYFQITKQVKVNKFNFRESEFFHINDNDHSHRHGSSSTDPHLWLSIHNVIAITKELLKYLQKINPNEAAQYDKNAKKFIKELNKVDTSIKKNLKKFPQKYVIVFHDAYQYFEKSYKLKNIIGSLTVNPEMPLKPKTLVRMHNEIRKKNISCILKDPQFSHSHKGIIKDLGVKSITVDPIGSEYLQKMISKKQTDISSRFYKYLFVSLENAMYCKSNI